MNIAILYPAYCNYDDRAEVEAQRSKTGYNNG